MTRINVGSEDPSLELNIQLAPPRPTIGEEVSQEDSAELNE